MTASCFRRNRRRRRLSCRADACFAIGDPGIIDGESDRTIASEPARGSDDVTRRPRRAGRSGVASIGEDYAC